jgi:predicted nucleotidyltransferase
VTVENSAVRRRLLEEVRRFVSSARQVPGVRRIGLLGSIVSDRPDPKDIDVLVVIGDEADLAPLAACARRLQGRTQSFNRGADVFLANERGNYLGRTCHWKECRPGVRASCDALHCGRRPYLHDDLATVRLPKATVVAPPVTLWPRIERRCALPPDVEDLLAQLEHAT